MQTGPDFVFNQSTRYQSLVPQRGRWSLIFREEMRERDGRIEVDHRSRLSVSNSPRILLKGATGIGDGGSPEIAMAGGVNQPLRTAEARNASARTGLLVSPGGRISATTRSWSVTRTVSPDAASRTYSLSRLFSTLIPTDLIIHKVATRCYFINWHQDSAFCVRGVGCCPRTTVVGFLRAIACDRGPGSAELGAWPTEEILGIHARYENAEAPSYPIHGSLEWRLPTLLAMQQRQSPTPGYCGPRSGPRSARGRMPRTGIRSATCASAGRWCRRLNRFAKCKQPVRRSVPRLCIRAPASGSPSRCGEWRDSSRPSGAHSCRACRWFR